MLLDTYYAKNYASIIDPNLITIDTLSNIHDMKLLGLMYSCNTYFISYKVYNTPFCFDVFAFLCWKVKILYKIQYLSLLVAITQHHQQFLPHQY